MNNDLGARTQKAKEISKKSRSIVSSIVKGDAPEDRIKQRCVIATGDPAFADLMRFNNEPIRAGIKAIIEKAPIFIDVTMAQAGITKLGHRCNVRCVLEEGDEIAGKTGVTRTSAGFMATPVGFVNTAKSKEMVRTFDTPSITCTGTRGGTPVAVAVVNELVEIAIEGKKYLMTKAAISIPRDLLKQFDCIVREKGYPSRSEAI